MEGFIVWFNPTKHYGFIGRGHRQSDLFFHQFDVLATRELRADDRVLFDLSFRNGRDCAVNVELAADLEPKGD